MKQGALVVGAVFSLGLSAQAAEVTFTGGDTSNPTNLASAANWGGTLPGAENVGVINLSQTPAQGYVVNGSLELSGLKITNNAGKTVRICGEGPLTLGADGVTLTGTASFIVRCPIVTTANQTWQMANGGTLETYSTFTGTHEISFLAYAYLNHCASPNYGGSMRYTSYMPSSDANQWVSYQATGKWATDVYFDKGWFEFKEPANGDIKWADIFPDNPPHVAWSAYPVRLIVRRNGTYAMIFDEGDVFDGSGHPSEEIAGIFEQRGGSIVTHKGYGLTLGISSSVSTWDDDNICHYRMKGGSLKTGKLWLGGKKIQDATGTKYLFDQTGGTVECGKIDASNQGGGLMIGAKGGTCYPYSVVEYRMGGGSLTCGGYGNSINFGLCAPSAALSNLPASLFVQTNGTVSSFWLSIGNTTDSPVSVNDGYGLLDLSGGSFSLVQDTPLKMSSKWNDGVASNSVYAIRFHGGSFAVPNNYLWPLSAYFPKTAVGTSFGTGNRNLDWTAPIWGPGKLVKEGTGALVLTDATHFRGSLDVKAGTVTMKGATGSVEGEDGCFCWTADALSATLSDGAFVETWTDSNQGVVATTNGCKMLTKSANFKPPKFKANAYNGHAAVDCSDYGVLCVPWESNPLYGQTNCSIVAVLRPTNNEGNITPHYDRAFLAVYPDPTLSEFCLSMTQSRFGAERNFWGDKTPEGQTAGAKIVRYEPGDKKLDGVHAVALSFDNNGITYSVDGYHTNQYWRTSSATAPIGWGSSNWKPSNVERQLQIGGVYMTDNTSRFIGDILEFRIYTNRVFSAEEQKTLTRSLVEKYDASPARLATFDAANSQVKTGFRGGFTSWAAPSAPSADLSFDADTIDAADGAAVTAWTSADGTKSATTSVSGKAAPKLVKNVASGHAAVHFTSASKTALGLAAADSPISGKSAFAAAVVWRTTVPAPSAASTSQPMGMVSTKQATNNQADFVLGTISRDAVSASYTTASGNQTLATRKPCLLCDGDVHISILSCDGDGKTYKLMTDGVFLEGSLSAGSARGAFDVWFGCRRPGASSNAEFFEGDLLAIKLYGSALTKAQMRDLGESWAAKYGTQLLVGYKYELNNVRAIGLGATNVTVAAGARLSLPLSDTAPFTLKTGSTLSGAGEFLGTYKFLAGSVFDLTGATPSFFDELNLAGGATVKVSKDAFGTYKVRRLVATGANAIDIGAGSAVPGHRETLLSYDEAEIDPAATWTVVNGDANMSVVHDPINKRLLLRSQFGLSIIVR